MQVGLAGKRNLDDTLTERNQGFYELEKTMEEPYN